MKMNLEISKILDEFLPSDGVDTEREKLRIKLHNALTTRIPEIGGWKSIKEKPSFGDINGKLKTSKDVLVWDGQTQQTAYYDFDDRVWRDTYNENELIDITLWRNLYEPPKTK